MGDPAFIASKLVGLAARAETWLVVLVALGFVAGLRGRLRAARWWSGAALAALLALTMYPLGDPLLAGLEGRYPRAPALDRVGLIVVLGGAEDLGPALRWGGVQLNEGGERLAEGLALARRFPQARLVFTGGVAALDPGPVAGLPGRMARDMWEELGIDPARIVLESASRNTAENARDTLARLGRGGGEGGEEGGGGVTVIVTSGFHMPRAMETFARAGWEGLVAWPVDFRSSGMTWRPQWKLGRHLADLDVALKECLGLLAYRVIGY